jgi:hypothetical protein
VAWLASSLDVSKEQIERELRSRLGGRALKKALEQLWEMK